MESASRKNRNKEVNKGGQEHDVNKFSGDRNFRFVYSNVDCLMNKREEFQVRYIQSDAGIDCDFIAFTEVLPKNNRYPINKAEIQIEGYEMFPGDFPGNMKRGTVLYVKEDLRAVEIDMGTRFQECVFVKVDLNSSEKLLIGCIYRSPSSDEDNVRELNQLIRLIGEKSREYKNIVLVGDFNFPNIDWNLCTGKDDMSDNFIEAVRDAFLYQVVEENTRSRVDQNPSLIDLILVNDENMIEEVKYAEPIGRSDHCVLDFIVKVNRWNTNQGKETFRYNYKKANFKDLKEALSIDWEICLGEKSCKEMTEEFMNILEEKMDTYIPKTRTNLRKGKVPLSKECVCSIRKKHRLWEKYMRNRTDENYRAYTKARNKLKGTLLRERKVREKDIAKSAKSNVKNFWKFINSKRKTKSGISELNENGQTAVTDREKADVLANFFSSVFTTEDTNSDNYRMENRCEEKSDDSPFTIVEVNKLLKDLDVTKSPGPDNFHPKVLHELADVIDRPLTIIFNKSFESGILPDIWKIGQITALFKKGDKKLASNYRPVSLTSVVCKTMEKLIRKKIVDHMKKYNLFSDKQFGFISGRSTVLQLLCVLEDWTKSLDEGGEIDVIFMDFMKAFDKVPHRRLIYKMKKYGLSDKICSWVNDFLSNRKQRVKVNGEFSTWKDVTSGIPQGSVLGPILFVLFINDLPEEVDSTVYLFADDTKIYRQVATTGDVSTLQNDIDNLFNWSSTWLLRFHPDKCKALHISNRSSSAGGVYTMNKYEGGSVTLEAITNEKDIGVTMDKRLQFEEHIHIQIKKANMMMGIIRRSFAHLDMETFCLLYKALVRPHLEYACSVWNPYKKKLIEELENVQRRATKLVPGLSNLPYEERLKKLDLPTLKFRRMRGDMIEVYKITSGKYDTSVCKDLFELNTTSSTRGHSKKFIKKGPS